MEGVEFWLGQNLFKEMEKASGKQEWADQQWKSLRKELAGRERLAAEINDRKREIEELR